jgi:hypothetical protein
MGTCNSIVGNQENARLWLRGTNSALESKPIDLIFKTEGLIDAIRYLDSHHNRIREQLFLFALQTRVGMSASTPNIDIDIVK